ncbi:MAG: hypothetical protein ACI9OJ_000904 [Myxococcota bacterium]|jgi:hypothetical protein
MRRTGIFEHITVLTAVASLLAVDLASADWPMPYQNARLTRTVYATGALTTPSIRWKKRLGGQNPPALVQDVTGNGSKEVVTLIGGRAVCRNPDDGGIIWSTAGLSLGKFMTDSKGRATDLNGDGHLDLMVSKASVGDTRIYALDGRTGKIQWTFGAGLGPNSGVNGSNQHALLNIDDDPQSEFVLWVPSNDAGAVLYAFDFAAGFTGDPLQWTTEPLGYNGRNVFSVFDPTGDGDPRIFLSSAAVLHVIDPKTGDIETSTTEWYGDTVDVPYGLRVEPVQIDNTPGSKLFVQYHFGGNSSFVGVWQRAEDGALETVWRVEPNGIFRSAHTADLDGDGRSEVILTGYAVDDEAIWTTRVLSGATGETVAVLKHWISTGKVGDIDGDGRADVMVSSAKGPTIDPISVLQAAHFNGSAFEARWESVLDGATLAALIDRDDDDVFELVVYRDSDNDGALDRLEIVTDVAAHPQVIAGYDFAKGTQLIFKTSSDHVVGTEAGQMVVFASDGFVDTLSSFLVPVGTRLAAGGYAPEFLAADGGALVNDSTGRTVRVDLATGSPDTEPVSKTLYPAGTDHRILLMVDVEGDGTRERLVFEDKAGVPTYSLTDEAGVVRWAFQPAGAKGPPEVTPGTGGDIDGDGVLDFYIMAVIEDIRTGIPVNGKTGLPFGWIHQPYQSGGGFGTPYSPAIIHDFDADGLADVLVARYQDRLDGHEAPAGNAFAPVRVMKGTTGETIATSQVSLDPCRTSLVELDPDTNTRDILLSWWKGRGGLSLTPGPEAALDVLWATGQTGAITRGMPMAIDITGDGGDDMIHFDHTIARVRAHRGFDGEQLWGGERVLSEGTVFKALDDGTFEEIATGSISAQIAPNGLREAAVMVSNLTGEGHPTAVFAGNDGILYALNAQDGTLDWSFDFGFALSGLVAVDTDGDGLIEVVVTAQDGHMYSVGQAADLGLIGEVRDGIGSDIDSVSLSADGITPKLVSANWDETVGGSEATLGYYVRVLTDTGAVVRDWEDVGDVTQVALGAYSPLSPGVTYRVVVMPYGTSGAGQVFRSDGFFFKDEDGDGLLAGDEALLGTNPLDADSDDDGLDDGVETNGGQPIDSDMDGIIDALDEDSDNDSLLDSVEGVFDTDGDDTPDYRDPDDDNDGIGTLKEVSDGEKFGADPDLDEVPAWHDDDSDGDFISDLVEGAGDTDNDGIPNYLDNFDDTVEVSPGSGNIDATALASTESTGCAVQPGVPGGTGGLAFMLALTLLIVWRRAAARYS